MTTTVQARFVENRLAFVGVERKIGCIYSIEVREQESGNLVWNVPYQPGDNRRCDGGDPHFYGQRYVNLRTDKAPATLRLGVIYEVTGTASGSNYFGGAFRIVRPKAYRIEDMPMRSLDQALTNNAEP